MLTLDGGGTTDTLSGKGPSIHIHRVVVPGSLRGPCGPDSDERAPVTFRIEDRFREPEGAESAKSQQRAEKKRERFSWLVCDD
jgi:hypothetical protein